jgi:hypothetical protein
MTNFGNGLPYIWCSHTMVLEEENVMEFITFGFELMDAHHTIKKVASPHYTMFTVRIKNVLPC